MSNYIEKLKADLVEQFRGRPKIEALLEVIGKQFNDVFRFYYQMRTETDVHTAIGKQLDGIGDIVVLTRADVSQYVPSDETYDALDDETYRQYLIHKVLKNTCNCTYPDLIEAFKLFWDRPVYYSEDPEQPATMILDTGEIEGAVDTRPLFRTPTIRAAGVTLKIIAKTNNAVPTADLTIASDIGNGISITPIPNLV